MFERLAIHGDTASLVWAYHTAASLSQWRITKANNKQWTLRATVARIDPFQARQRPLLFSAPHSQGFWRWEVQELHLTDGSLTATLGPPL